MQHHSQHNFSGREQDDEIQQRVPVCGGIIKEKFSLVTGTFHRPQNTSGASQQDGVP